MGAEELQKVFVFMNQYEILISHQME